MRILLALVLGIVIGVVAVWLYRDTRLESRTEKAAGQIQDAAKSAQETLQDKLRSLNLDGGTISNELERTGRVIREKAQQTGQAISDATADARITAAIKARLVRDPDLSAWNITVNTSDGVVTLSGTASTADQVGKAVLLAMETEGVRQVISVLQVK